MTFYEVALFDNTTTYLDLTKVITITDIKTDSGDVVFQRVRLVDGSDITVVAKTLEAALKHAQGVIRRFTLTPTE